MATPNPLPPGSNGLPLLGETLAFAKNPFAFIGQRRARFGDVFRTSILGKPTVDIAGPKHVPTWLDPTKIQRAGVILCHNHPSGRADPSPGDVQLTRLMQRSLALVDIRVLDHFVVGGCDVTSFVEEGLL